jgi:hypothetical protein
MALFLFFVVVVLFLIFRGKKSAKKTAKPKQNPFKQPPAKVVVQRPAVPRPFVSSAAPAARPVPPHVPAPSPPSPVQVALDMATKHFGWEWEDYLKTKPVLPVATPVIQRHFASAYQSLPQMELRDFLYSLINTQTTGNYDAAGKLIPRKPYIYHDLHLVAYELVSQQRLNERDIHELIKGLVRDYRERKKAEKLQKQTVEPIAIIPVDQPAVIPLPENTKEPETSRPVLETISEIINSVSEAKVVPPIQITSEKLAMPNVIDIAPGDVKLNLEFSIGGTVATNTGNSFTSTTNHVYQGYNPDDYKFGKKYKDKMGLTPQEVIWLDKFTIMTNQFNAVESCAIAINRLYLAIIKKMVWRFWNEKIGLQQRMEEIKEIAYKFSLKEHGHWQYFNHEEVKTKTESDLYYTVYKKAENAVRTGWGCSHISPAFYARTQDAIDLFKLHIEPVLDEVILGLTATIPLPDDATEIILNQQSTTKWKREFEKITVDPAQNIKAMATAIHHLAKLNKKNPSVENIYYEAAKFMAPIHKTEALNMYLYYIKSDQKSARIDNKPFNKTNQKQLFKTSEQQAEFQTIVEELIVFKDIKQSLKKVAVFYEPKRKRITLDNSAIALAGQELSGTVDVLNKYLKEEDEPEPAIHEVNTHTSTIGTQTEIIAVAGLSVLQLELLTLFQSNNFNLSSETVTAFAQQHGAFKNQLIESINDACIDVLDDVLIEEDGENYTIEPDYFSKIYTS